MNIHYYITKPKLFKIKLLNRIIVIKGFLKQLIGLLSFIKTSLADWIGCIHKLLKDDSLIISTCTRIVCTSYTCISCTYTLVCMSFLDLLTDNVS